MTAPIELLSVPMCGLPCVVCEQPVRLLTIYPRGIRTVHDGGSGPPCDYLRPPRKPRTGAVSTRSMVTPDRVERIVLEEHGDQR
jgi:hypothetical protein